MIMNEDLTTESKSIVAPALISGVVAAGLALLLAPKSGRDLRGDIGRLVKKTGDQASATIEEAKTAVSEAVQTGQESLMEGQEKISEALTYQEPRSLVLPILISGVVGASLALLFAPKAGKEVIQDIKGMASTAAEKSKDLYQKGAAAVKDALEKGKEAAQEEKAKMRPAA